MEYDSREMLKAAEYIEYCIGLIKEGSEKPLLTTDEEAACVFDMILAVLLFARERGIISCCHIDRDKIIKLFEIQN